MKKFQACCVNHYVTTILIFKSHPSVSRMHFCWACVCVRLAWFPYFITKMQNYFGNNDSRYDTHFHIHNAQWTSLCSRCVYVCAVGHMFVYSFVCTSLSSTFYIYLQCRTSCQHSACSANSYANAHTNTHRFKWLNIIYLLLLALLWLLRVECLHNEFDGISVILYILFSYTCFTE